MSCVPGVAAAVFMLAFASAGCLDTEEDDLLFTALEGKAVADWIMMDEQSDAKLLAIYGLEAGRGASDRLWDLMQSGEDEEGHRFEDGPRQLLADVARITDRHPGDGRATAWIYSYGDASGAFYVVTVTSHSTILDVQPDRIVTGFNFGLKPKPLRSSLVDSTAAADAAMQDQEFRMGASRPEAVVTSILVQAGESPVWVMITSEEPGQLDGPGAKVLVDAATGQVIGDPSVLEGLTGTLRESGAVSGEAVLGGGGSFTTSFDIELEGHKALVVLARVSPPPVSSFTFDVTAPDNHRYTATISPAIGTQATKEIVIKEVLRGTYEVRVSAGLSTEWGVSWCSDGKVGAAVATPACEFLPA